MRRPEEQTRYWEEFGKMDLAERCAMLHRQRREVAEAKASDEVHLVRRTVASIFVKGDGVEVGAGSRPFPIPPGTRCNYGDVRDRRALQDYFKKDEVTVSHRINAQTFDGVPNESLDFIISAHVLEHLYDPIRAVKEGILRLRHNGIFLLVLPELTQTFDRRRASTTLDHLLADEKDGGEGTRLLAHVEHCRYVHPELTGEIIEESAVERHAYQTMEAGMDLHVHAWTESAAFEMLDHVARQMDCRVEARVSILNENIFVIKRL